MIKLSKVPWEDILSSSFELLAINSSNYAVSTLSTPTSSSSTEKPVGPSFHERTAIDAISEYSQSRGVVLATTELCLRCVTRVGTREAVASEEEVLLEQRVLLMLNSRLESVLDISDR